MFLFEIIIIVIVQGALLLQKFKGEHAPRLTVLPLDVTDVSTIEARTTVSR